MGKAKFLVPLLGLASLGVAAYAAARDECSHAPAGAFDLRLAFDGIRHQLDDEASCNPWAVVEPDRTVRSVTIVPYSVWTDAPSRPVTISADGTISVSEPLDRSGEATRELVIVTDLSLAERLLDDLRRLTRYNRQTLANLDELVAKLPENADLWDALIVAPKTKCRGQLFDGGGVHLEYVDELGRQRTSFLDSYCDSVAMREAIGTAWRARERAFERTGFSGEHFADHLAAY